MRRGGRGATGMDAELVNALEARALELRMPRTDALDFAQVLAEHTLVCIFEGAV